MFDDEPDNANIHQPAFNEVSSGHILSFHRIFWFVMVIIVITVKMFMIAIRQQMMIMMSNVQRLLPYFFRTAHISNKYRNQPVISILFPNTCFSIKIPEHYFFGIINLNLNLPTRQGAYGGLQLFGGKNLSRFGIIFWIKRIRRYPFTYYNYMIWCDQFWGCSMIDGDRLCDLATCMKSIDMWSPDQWIMMQLLSAHCIDFTLMV